MKINLILKEKHELLIHSWSDKALKGTIVNRIYPSINEGSLKIKIIVQ